MLGKGQCCRFDAKCRWKAWPCLVRTGSNTRPFQTWDVQIRETRPPLGSGAGKKTSGHAKSNRPCQNGLAAGWFVPCSQHKGRVVGFLWKTVCLESEAKG